MTEGYLQILIESLEKKIIVLDQIIELDKSRQRSVLTSQWIWRHMMKSWKQKISLLMKSISSMMGSAQPMN